MLIKDCLCMTQPVVLKNPKTNGRWGLQFCQVQLNSDCKLVIGGSDWVGDPIHRWVMDVEW